MYEIVTLYILSIKIGRLAAQKGLSILQWRFYTFLAFLTGDFVGLSIGLRLYGIEKWYKAILLVIPMSLAGYHIVRTILENKPDIYPDEINHIGENLQS